MMTSDVKFYADEIIFVFPSEDKRYYYNNRGAGKNPTEKLYDKATNLRKKIKKHTFTPVTESHSQSEKLADESGLKTWLLHNSAPWTDVCRNWQIKYTLRRREILNGGQSIFADWPLISNSLIANLLLKLLYKRFRN